jgi:hypothetical protein
MYMGLDLVFESNLEALQFGEKNIVTRMERF